jgi:hypothetical protein
MSAPSSGLLRMPREKEGGRIGVARFFGCSLGEGAFCGSSSVRNRVTGAIDARCGGTLREISGVECAYGVACCNWDEGGSGGIAVMAPAGIFQAKSGDGGISLVLNSNGICSRSIGFEEATGRFDVCFGVF